MNEDKKNESLVDEFNKNCFIVALIVGVLLLFGWGIYTKIENNNLHAELELYQDVNPNVAARYSVGENDVTAIEIVYYQTHDFVDELIVYKDGTGVARKGGQHIYFTPSECKLIIYHGE